MDGRLAARKLHHLRIAFGCYQVIEDIFHLFEREVEPGTGFGQAERASHMTGAIHLDDAQAGVLLVIGTKAAIVRAAVDDLGQKFERDRAGLVEPGRAASPWGADFGSWMSDVSGI